jgi:hypothetical protein
MMLFGSSKIWQNVMRSITPSGKYGYPFFRTGRDIQKALPHLPELCAHLFSEIRQPKYQNIFSWSWQ